jgi:ribosomal protein S18 acetylase RimI-like enzyme
VEPVIATSPAFSPRIRQYEAAGFRAWPAAQVSYDGTWMVRLTASHPAKRLNSINSLDPADANSIETRLARAAQKFRAYGRPLTLRVTPLTPPELIAYCDDKGWSRIGASLIMEAPINRMPLANVVNQLPLRDIGRFVDAAIATGSVLAANRAGLSEIIGAVEPAKGLFLRENAGSPQSTLVCVQDGQLAGLFEVATAVEFRRKGHARALLLAALKWAAVKGAQKAWLQVEEANDGALQLYSQLGFTPFYRYHYRVAPEGALL